MWRTVRGVSMSGLTKTAAKSSKEHHYNKSMTDMNYDEMSEADLWDLMDAFYAEMQQ